MDSPIASDNEPEKEKTSTIKGRALHEVWDFFKIFIVALAIVLPIRYFVAQPFIVNGASMEPTFVDSNYLIIDELSYYFRNPVRGEVIVFRYPEDESKYFIKRVVGLPGETISFYDSKVWIAESQAAAPEAVDELYLPAGLVTNGPTAPLTLQPNEYFVLGDNRPASFDSRRWGIVPRANITGRVLMRVWPIGGAGLIPTPHYSSQ